jgi:NitT/TauT family transport system substrate-binding protein
VRRLLKWASGVLALALITTACGSGTGNGGAAAGATGVRTVKIAIGATTAASIPLWVGIDQGIFAKHNFDVQLITLSGTKAPPALASGSVQISDSGISDLAGAIVAGSPITIVGTTYPYQFFRMYGKKGMTSPAQLAGKTIAASSAGSASDTAVQSAMAATGLQRGKDYQVTYIGDNAARSAALQQGVVDAIMVSPPTAQLVEQQGFPDIADLISEKAPYGYSSFGVLKSWAAENHAQLVEFLAAYAEAVEASKADKEAAYAAERKYLQLTDQKIIEDVYAVSVGVMPAYPSTDVQTVTATLALSQNADVVKADPNSMIDNSFVDEAKRRAPGGGT